jgi:hypothetical protein
MRYAKTAFERKKTSGGICLLAGVLWIRHQFVVLSGGEI